MGLLDSATALRASVDPRREAARELESLVLKQVLTSSGAFKGSEAAGASMWADLLAESVAAAVAERGGLGLGGALEAALPATPAPASALPAGVGTLTSGFGDRTDPLDGTHRFHSGVDLAAPEGTPILAVRAGVVVAAGPRGGYGNAVELRHADGSTTLYAHAASVGVVVGQQVKEGEPLGAVGSTGRSTGNHLHFEVRRGGHSLDPRAVSAALQIYRQRAEGSSGRGDRHEDP